VRTHPYSNKLQSIYLPIIRALFTFRKWKAVFENQISGVHPTYCGLCVFRVPREFYESEPC